MSKVRFRWLNKILLTETTLGKTASTNSCEREMHKMNADDVDGDDFLKSQ